ncbi:hypothetical protein H5410_035895 [Solanum commersonii]|uniref:Uncharacterized protein n=1 Tax=Solanum commersonii TaxID=4109 RepID=A0A9J5Y449_SOLCO|nr:hypothetical protein H5410_035895 [Solanum commersonii]
MNVHNKTQFIHARINCVPKDSSCDTPLPKILKLAILASNASSISTKNQMQWSLSERRTQYMLSPIVKIKKVFSRLVMGLSEQGFHFSQHNGLKGTFLTLLEVPLSFHHTPNLGFWPKLAIQSTTNQEDYR